jgi:hypothetical protein
VFDVANGTFQLWFNANATSTSPQTLIARDHNGVTAGEFSVNLVSAAINTNPNKNLSVHFETAGPSIDIATTNTPIQPGVWYQLTLTFGAAGLHTYLNTTEVLTDLTTVGMTLNNRVTTIGASNQGTLSNPGNVSNQTISRAFNGYLDEISFFDSALTANQIQQSRDRGPMGVITPNDLGTIDQTDTRVSIEQVMFTDGALVSTSSLANLARATAPAVTLATAANFASFAVDTAAPSPVKAIASVTAAPVSAQRIASAAATPATFVYRPVRTDVSVATQPHAADSGIKSGHHDEDWVVQAISGTPAKSRAIRSDSTEESRSREGAPKIDWDDEFAKYGSPHASKQGASAASGQTNVAEFDDKPRWAHGRK